MTIKKSARQEALHPKKKSRKEICLEKFARGNPVEKRKKPVKKFVKLFSEHESIFFVRNFSPRKAFGAYGLLEKF